MATIQELIARGEVELVVLNRHEDVAAVLRDPSFSSDDRNWEGSTLVDKVPPSTLTELMRHWMLLRDPPDHTRLRSLVNRFFSALAVEGLRSRIREVAGELLDDLDTRDEVELMTEFAFPLPNRVMCELLDVPPEDRAQLLGARNLATIFDPGPIPQDVLDKADPFVEYAGELIRDRRQAPGDDLLSELIHACDAQGRLSEIELHAMVLFLLGGFEATMNLIGSSVLMLLNHPEELARLWQDPSLIGPAVEEVLRLEPPVLATVRTCTAGRVIGSAEVRVGQLGVLMLAAANRDAEVFRDADRFDIGRNPNPHLSFGGGPHRCLGTALGRVTGQVAISSLFSRFPNLRLLREPKWRKSITLHGLEELWVTLR